MTHNLFAAFFAYLLTLEVIHQINNCWIKGKGKGKVKFTLDQSTKA